MSYIEFDKTDLINLKYSLERELLRTNRAGSYASSTVIFTNTRKYHGLLVAPQPLIDDNNHVLLSSIDETLIENNFEFHVSMRMYPGGNYDPKGHKYLRHFESDPSPRLTYRMGNIIFVKEYIYAKNGQRHLEQRPQTDIREQVRAFTCFRTSGHPFAQQQRGKCDP